MSPKVSNNPANLQLNYFNHNTEETRGIGRYFWSSKPGHPFQQIISLFYFEDYVASEERYDINGRVSFNAGKTYAKKNTLTAPKFFNVPYRKKSTRPVIDPQTGKEVYIAELAYLKKPYILPNRFNPYLGLEKSTEEFYGQQGAAGGAKLYGKDIVHLAPPVNEEELEASKNFGQVINEIPPINRTACMDTCNFFRSQTEYKKGKIREYVLMTFGDSIGRDKEGNELIVKAKDNIRLVPIRRNIRWRPTTKSNIENSLTDEEKNLPQQKKEELIAEKLLKHNDQAFLIDLGFIKKFAIEHRDVLERQRNLEERKKIEKVEEEYKDILEDKELLELAKELKAKKANKKPKK